MSTLKKFNIITKEENWKKAKIRAAEYGITLQEYWNRIFDIAFDAMSKKIEKDLAEGDQSVGTPNIEGGQPDAQFVPHFTTTAISKKRCKNCDQFRFTHPHTFIYEYNRITDELCDGCWTQAKRDGSARE